MRVLVGWLGCVILAVAGCAGDADAGWAVDSSSVRLMDEVGVHDAHVTGLARRVGDALLVELRWSVNATDVTPHRDAMAAVRLAGFDPEGRSERGLAGDSKLAFRMWEQGAEDPWWIGDELLDRFGGRARTWPEEDGVHLELELDAVMTTSGHDERRIRLRARHVFPSAEVGTMSGYDGGCADYPTARYLPLQATHLAERPAGFYAWRAVERDCAGGSGCRSPYFPGPEAGCPEGSRHACTYCSGDVCLEAGMVHCDVF